jgi:hypothetical protein
MPTTRRRSGTCRNNNTVVHASVRSKALCLVILGKTLLSLSLAFVAYQSLGIGHEMITNDSAQKTKAVVAQRAVDQQREETVVSNLEKGESSAILFEWGNLKATASGFGAVIMMSSVLFAVLAYMSRPQLSLRPVRGTRSTSSRTHTTEPPDLPALDR